MANIPMNGDGHAYGHDVKQSFTQLKSAGTMANWAGAVVSVGLIVGIGIWGYRLLVRDVSGVPVVRAVEGPMRVRAQDPGGRQAENQGLSVNRVAADGGVTPTADRLVLAPRAAELGDQDRTTPVIVAGENVDPNSALESNPQSNLRETGTSKPEISSIQALAEQLASGVSTLGSTAQNTYVAPLEAPEEKSTEELLASGLTPAPEVLRDRPVLKGLGRSLRPHTRPSSLNIRNIAPVSAVIANPVLDVDAASIPAGTRLVQLGAFASTEIAKKEWDRIGARFETYMDGKSRIIQKAKSGGRTFYRLRAMGFDDIAAARRFCSALAAERADCIPVVTR